MSCCLFWSPAKLTNAVSGMPEVLTLEEELLSLLLVLLFVASRLIFGIRGRTSTSTHTGFVGALIGWRCNGSAVLLLELGSETLQDEGTPHVEAPLVVWTPNEDDGRLIRGGWKHL